MMFRLTLFTVIAGLQLMLYLKARRWLKEQFPGAKAARAILMALFIVFDGSLAAALILFRVHIPVMAVRLMEVAVWPFYIWHGATLMLGIVLLAGILIALPFRLSVVLLRRLPWTGPRILQVASRPKLQRFDATRRVFLRRSVGGLTALSFGAATYGTLGGKSDYEYTTARFAIPDLPAELDGFRIGMVSDVHSSSFMTKLEMDAYVRALLSLQADMIVIPGDFVTSQTEEVYPFAEAFSALHAPCGVYGVMGNHDFFAQDPERVAREVDACGVRMLRNDAVVVEKSGGRFALLGVDDTGRPEHAAEMMHTAAMNLPKGLPRILLCHRPYFLEQASEAGLDLVLSGHTHGGQIVFGQIGTVVITPAGLASPYVWGRYRSGRTQMYVSRGIGTVGLPMRINCPPEVTTLTLTRA